MSDFIRGRPRVFEVPALALVNSGAVLLACHLWDKDTTGSLVAAGLTGLATYVAGRRVTTVGIGPRWHPGRWLVSAGLAMALSGFHAPTLIPPTYNYASAGRTIQISPCPKGHLFGPGPSGSFVCVVAVSPLPPDPGTGPVLASPSK
jgi:hypothetical protein